jgi:antitoxin component YwqK of YwqJK toxin-antitoxin module
MRPIILLIFFSVFTTSLLWGQIREDTIYTSDTMLIRTYKKNGKPDYERKFVKGEMVTFKGWFYRKIDFGYFITDSRQTKPKIIVLRHFYLDGRLKIDAITVNGKKQGKYRTYYQNGYQQCDCNYNYGKQDSISVMYFENGQIWTERIYKNGKIWTVLSNFDKKGNTLDKGTLKDGNGTLNVYDENAKLEEIQYFKNGKLKKREKNST